MELAPPALVTAAAVFEPCAAEACVEACVAVAPPLVPFAELVAVATESMEAAPPAAALFAGSDPPDRSDPHAPDSATLPIVKINQSEVLIAACGISLAQLEAPRLIGACATPNQMRLVRNWRDIYTIVVLSTRGLSCRSR